MRAHYIRVAFTLKNASHASNSANNYYSPERRVTIINLFIYQLRTAIEALYSWDIAASWRFNWHGIIIYMQLFCQPRVLNKTMIVLEFLDSTQSRKIKNNLPFLVYAWVPRRTKNLISIICSLGIFIAHNIQCQSLSMWKETKKKKTNKWKQV